MLTSASFSTCGHDEPIVSVWRACLVYRFVNAHQAGQRAAHVLEVVRLFHCHAKVALVIVELPYLLSFVLTSSVLAQRLEQDSLDCHLYTMPPALVDSPIAA
jgi:hypothetical protein